MAHAKLTMTITCTQALFIKLGNRMPKKFNAKRRHHIPKMKLRVRNWPEYEDGLRNRGSLTFWVTPQAMHLWPAQARSTAGGQSRYSDQAIQTPKVQKTHPIQYPDQSRPVNSHRHQPRPKPPTQRVQPQRPVSTTKTHYPQPHGASTVAAGA